MKQMSRSVRLLRVAALALFVGGIDMYPWRAAIPVQAADTPAITSISFSGNADTPLIVIDGEGSAELHRCRCPPAYCMTGGYDYATGGVSAVPLRIEDFSQHPGPWGAGQARNCVGLADLTYSATQVSFGFADGYANYRSIFSLNQGDPFQVEVNALVCVGVVDYTAPVLCTNSTLLAAEGAAITSVAFTGNADMPLITVHGAGFGTAPTPVALPYYCMSGGDDYTTNVSPVPLRIEDFGVHPEVWAGRSIHQLRRACESCIQRHAGILWFCRRLLQVSRKLLSESRRSVPG